MAIWKTRHLSAVAPYVAEHLKKYLFFQRPIRIIPNGMPDAIFNRIKPKKPDGAVISYGTVLSGWSGLKNSEAAIQAFALVHKINPNTRLIMFGSGHGANEQAEQWSNAQGLQEGIEFIGHIPYGQLIENLCNEIDILVHPALEEAQPMSLIEAMAMGIPVIAGESSGGVPWTLDDGRAGILLDVTQPKKIAESMLKLAEDADERNRVGQTGLNLARQRFHISNVTDAYLQAYEDILEGNWI
jgi:glycosyltransferase involved in cell wall biosynthesis